MRSVLALLGALLAGDAAAQAQRCIDLRTDRERYYGCLNEDLRRLVPSDRARTDPPLPYSAAGQPFRAGGFSIAGTRQMLGRNFGVSNKPDRVPRSTAASPLFAGRR